MQVLIVNQAEVPRLLPMKACMEAMAEALRSVSRGESVLPLRQVIMLPDQAGAFGSMPAYLGSPPALRLEEQHGALVAVSYTHLTLPTIYSV